jgi:hypothetical protein
MATELAAREPGPRTRATDSSRQGVPRRVRSSLWLSVVAIPRKVAPPKVTRKTFVNDVTEKQFHAGLD